MILLVVVLSECLRGERDPATGEHHVHLALGQAVVHRDLPTADRRGELKGWFHH